MNGNGPVVPASDEVRRQAYLGVVRSHAKDKARRSLGIPWHLLDPEAANAPDFEQWDNECQPG